MIKGNFCFGKTKVDVRRELKLDNLAFKKLISKTGIKYIYRASKKENSLTLGIKSAKSFIKQEVREEISGLIFVSQSPQSLIPSTGSIIHRELNLKNNCFVLDMIQGCSGFTYALSLASKMIETKELNNCLIICSETYTKYIEKKNKNCLPIFSDAASAIFLNKKNNPKLLANISITDGTGEKNLILKNKRLFMHGSEVFAFTADQVPKATEALLKKSKLRIDDVGLFVYHQASRVVLEFIKNKLEIPNNKFVFDMTDYGNTVSSSIPIALLRSKNKIGTKPVLMMGFGVGYSLCGGIYKFD